MEEKIELLRKGIIAEVPQVPFLIDQVDNAISWCIEEHEEGDLVKILETSLDVAKYIRSVSDPNFYKTHLLLASLLGDIENVKENEKFKQYQTASGAVEKSINALLVNKEDIAKRGCFNALNIHLATLARTDQECFIVALYGILHDLKNIISGMKEAGVKSPITPQDYITILGYAYTMTNLRMSGLNVLNKARELMNQINIILNNDVIY